MNESISNTAEPHFLDSAFNSNPPLVTHMLQFQIFLAFWAATPKRPMTYAFTQGKFLLRMSTPFEAHILALRLKSQP